MNAHIATRPPNAPIRVLIVDDQAVMRNGLRITLHPYADIEVVGEASSGPLAVTAAAQLRPDVVLMDLRMPAGDGVTATRQIVAGGSGAAVLVFTTFDLDEDVYGAIDAGASGYLLKDVEPDDLAAAVRALVSGEDVVDAKVVRTVFAELRRRNRQASPTTVDASPLTSREREILEGLAAGKTNKEIARDLVMEPGGVKSAISRMLGKYDAKTRTQLITWAFQKGYLG
ncbi:response regulator [uncultured Microbacterium sp.]|uniref:response regulator n=1 Tax=uncultured Microbacterium sp. TaxID=191216 RepID=UPI0035CAFBEB